MTVDLSALPHIGHRPSSLVGGVNPSRATREELRQADGSSRLRLVFARRRCGARSCVFVLHKGSRLFAASKKYQHRTKSETEIVEGWWQGKGKVTYGVALATIVFQPWLLMMLPKEQDW